MEHLNFIRQLAAAMGATVVRECDDETRNGYTYAVVECEGVQFRLSAYAKSYHYKAPTATISACWPTDEAGRTHAYSEVHYAHAAMSRGVEAVAKDFSRRFLPGYSQAYAAACKRRDEADAYADAKENAAIELAALGPGLFKVGGDSRVRWHTASGQGYGSAYASGGSGYLEAKSISPDKLRRIMAVIAEAE